MAKNSRPVLPPAPTIEQARERYTRERFTFLETRFRARPVFAHRAVAPIGELVKLLGELAGAIGHCTNDTRWHELADRLCDRALGGARGRSKRGGFRRLAKCAKSAARRIR